MDRKEKEYVEEVIGLMKVLAKIDEKQIQGIAMVREDHNKLPIYLEQLNEISDLINNVHSTLKNINPPTSFNTVKKLYLQSIEYKLKTFNYNRDGYVALLNNNESKSDELIKLAENYQVLHNETFKLATEELYRASGLKRK